MSEEFDYLCVGVCLPDENGAYCIGCGRPWGEKEQDDLCMPADAEDDVPDAPA
jgi:predicted Fe-S protein YdhL (DUF1289 family)